MGAMASEIIDASIVCSTDGVRVQNKETSKLHISGFCEGNPPVTAEKNPFDDVITVFPPDDICSGLEALVMLINNSYHSLMNSADRGFGHYDVMTRKRFLRYWPFVGESTNHQ